MRDMKRAFILLCIVLLTAAAGLSQSQIKREKNKKTTTTTNSSSKKTNSNSKNTNNNSKNTNNTKSSSSSSQSKPAETPKAEAAKPDYAYQEYVNIVNNWDLDQYNEYLNRYPNSSYRNEILRRKAEIELWRKATNENTIEAYESYLRNSSYDHFRENAEEAIAWLEEEFENEETEEFNRAKRMNTIAAYDEFIKDYPNSKYVKDARYYINELKIDNDWKAIKNSYDLSAYENFYRQHPDFSLKYEVEDRINAEKGRKFYEDGNYIASYSSFSLVQDPDLFYDSRYVNAYRNSKEEYQFINMDSNTSPEQIRKYLTEFPNSNHREEVENYLAMSLANSFDLNSTEADYANALAMARNKPTKNYVNERIKSNKNSQKEWAKQESRNAKELAKRAQNTNSDIVKPKTPRKRFVGFGISFMGGAGEISDELDGQFGAGMALILGRTSHRVQATLGVGAMADFFREGKTYTKFSLPANVGIKVNLAKGESGSFFLHGDYSYNIMYSKEFSRPMAWDVGFGFTAHKTEMRFYYKMQAGEYTGPFQKYADHTPWYVGISYGLNF